MTQSNWDNNETKIFFTTKHSLEEDQSMMKQLNSAFAERFMICTGSTLDMNVSGIVEEVSAGAGESALLGDLRKVMMSRVEGSALYSVSHAKV